MDELEEEQDLSTLVSDYLSPLSLTPPHIQGVVKFYLAVKRASTDRLTDGTGHKPHFSLRTLCRALRYAASNPCGQVSRSLYEVRVPEVCSVEQVLGSTHQKFLRTSPVILSWVLVSIRSAEKPDWCIDRCVQWGFSNWSPIILITTIHFTFCLEYYLQVTDNFIYKSMNQDVALKEAWWSINYTADLMYILI